MIISEMYKWHCHKVTLSQSDIVTKWHRHKMTSS
jgi:hypothetical protein